MVKPYIEVHRHRCGPLPVGRLAFDFTWSMEEDVEGGSTVSVTFKCPVVEFNYHCRPGDHLVLRNGAGVTEAWAIVDSIDGSYSASSDGRVSTSGVRVACVGWFNYLSRVALSAPVGEVKTIGTLFSVQDWMGINALIAQDYTGAKLGAALTKLHERIANVAIPESLGGGTFGTQIPVVYDEDTARRFAPARVTAQEDVSNAAGASPGRLSWGFHETKVREAYHGAFVPDVHLIELFPSLEDLSATEAQSSATPESSMDMTPLAKNLGRRPILIYRLKPFRARPLLEVVRARNDIPELSVDARGAELVRRAVLTLTGSEAAATREEVKSTARNTGAAVGSASVRAEQLALLEENFDRVTWDTTRAVEIPQRAVRSHSFTWNDMNRVNAVTINLSPDTSGGVEAWSQVGLPMTNKESIEDHGLRITRPSWPFWITDKDKVTNWVAYMRSVAATLMQFEQSSHLMASGTIVIDYDRVNTRVRVGDILRLKIPGGSADFFAYAHAVSREFRVSTGDGRETAVTRVQYVRGLYGIEELREAPVAITQAAATPARRAATGVATGGARGGQKSSGHRLPDQTTILFDGAGIPWLGTAPVDLWLLTKELSRIKRTPPSIDKAILHYTDGAVESLTAKGAWRTFNKLDPFSHGVDSHFIIEADGRIVQIMDLALTAYHAGESNVNRSSVGIDFVCPQLMNSNGFIDRATPQAPWTYKTGFDVVGGVDVSSKRFYAPTQAQLDACRQLLAWCNAELGVPLVAPSASSDRTKVRYWDGPYSGGVYHHAEVYRGRADCLGVYIPTDVL